MKKYKIKSEDKIAFLNKLEKVGVKVNTNQIKDEVDNDPHFFIAVFTNSGDIEKVDNILDQSSKINQIKEVLRRIIRKELSK